MKKDKIIPLFTAYSKMAKNEIRLGKSEAKEAILDYLNILEKQILEEIERDEHTEDSPVGRIKLDEKKLLEVSNIIENLTGGQLLNALFKNLGIRKAQIAEAAGLGGSKIGYFSLMLGERASITHTNAVNICKALEQHGLYVPVNKVENIVDYARLKKLKEINKRYLE